MNYVHIGTFYGGNSFVHKLTAQTKIIFEILFIVSAVCTKTLIGFAVLLIPIFILIFLSNTSVKLLLKSLKNILIFLCMIFVLNALFFGGNRTIWHFGIINITQDGILQGLKISCRIIDIVLLSLIIHTTTAPKKITDAFCRFLYPLRIFKIPIETFALMINIAVQFIPIILDEAEKIIRAQKIRTEFSYKKIFSYNAKNVIPLILPVFLASFQRADELATAMESRGYKGERNRKIPSEKKSVYDYVVMIFSLMFCTIAVLFF
ncbi:MAG: energy-coupling factor transporter transmembrane component T family protein [Treponemataceae bacterium]